MHKCEFVNVLSEDNINSCTKVRRNPYMNLHPWRKSHFNNFGRWQYYENNFTCCKREYSIWTISEDNSIKIFYSIHLSSMEKNYNIIVSIRGIPPGKRSSKQCPYHWRTSDIHQNFRLLHSFNSSQDTQHL